MYDRQALIALVRQKALRFGQFTLASGKTASYYLDGKQVTLDPHGARLVGEGILDLLQEGQMPDAIGGMSIGADPITAAVVVLSSLRGAGLWPCQPAYDPRFRHRAAWAGKRAVTEWTRGDPTMPRAGGRPSRTSVGARPGGRPGE